MFKKLKEHIMGHKKYYTLGSISLLLAFFVLFGQSAMFSEISGGLTGYIGRYKRPSINVAMYVNVKPVQDTYKVNDVLKLSWLDKLQYPVKPSLFSRFFKKRRYSRNPVKPYTERTAYTLNLISDSGSRSYISNTFNSHFTFKIPASAEGKYKIEVRSNAGKVWRTRDWLNVESPSTALTNGEALILIHNKLKLSSCYKDMCAEMSNHREEEKARCNLEKRNVFNPPAPDYDWYDEEMGKEEASRILQVLFNEEFSPSELSRESLSSTLENIDGSIRCISNGELVTLIHNKLKTASCYEDMCAEMSNHREEEKARCNLEKRNVFNPPAPDYDWYDEFATEDSIMNIIHKTFNFSISVRNNKPLRVFLEDILQVPDDHSMCCKPLNRAGLAKLLVDKFDLLNNYEAPSSPTYLDVAENAWYYDYVEAITKANLMTAMNGNIFNPSAYITKADFIKMVISAIDGLDGYEAPSNPTYSDVLSNAWYYDYIEAATQLGLITGVTDGDGNLTNFFTPSNIANSCFVKDVLSNINQDDFVDHNESNTLGSLDVKLNQNFSSHSASAGASDVEALSIDLTTDNTSLVTIKKISVKAYADTSSSQEFSQTGDTAANTVIGTMSLFVGDNILSGPENITLMDATGNNNFDEDSGDAYSALFDNLDFIIDPSTTKNIVVKVKLLNTISNNVYFALDLNPSDDILAENSSGNTIDIESNNLNKNSPHNVEISVLKAGTLTADVVPMPSEILTAGSRTLLSSYNFNAIDEAFIIDKLTLVNDLQGQFDSPEEQPSAISNLAIRYKDIVGVEQYKTSVLSGGSVTFSGLNMYVPKNGSSPVEIYVDIVSSNNFNENSSGQKIRIGLKDTNNTADTFNAVGQSSLSNITFDNAMILGQDSIEQFTIRKSKLIFKEVSSANTTLINGENLLYKFTVQSPIEASASLARIVFDVNTSANLTLDNLKLKRDSYNVDSANVNLINVNSDTKKVIISFNQEESINANVIKEYSLYADVSGVVNDSFITTKIAIDNAEVTAKTANTTDNTASLWSSNAANSLMSNSTNFVNIAENNRNILWSDLSANNHKYDSTVSSGTLAGDSSYDWTNGYFLGLNQLNAKTLMN